MIRIFGSSCGMQDVLFQSNYYKRGKGMYYLFDDERINLNPIFKERELEKFYAMWEDGASLSNIARKLGRKNLDIALLIIDRAEAGVIKSRGTGIFGQ